MNAQTPAAPIFGLVTELEDTIGRLHRYVHLSAAAVYDPVARATVVDMALDLVAPADQLMIDYDRLWRAAYGGAASTAPDQTRAPVSTHDLNGLLRAVPADRRDAVLAEIRALVQSDPAA